MIDFGYPLKNIKVVRDNPWFLELVEKYKFGSKEFNELYNMLIAGKSKDTIKERAEKLIQMRDAEKRKSDNGLDDRYSKYKIL